MNLILKIQLYLHRTQPQEVSHQIILLTTNSLFSELQFLGCILNANQEYSLHNLYQVPRIHFQSFAFTIARAALTEPLIHWFLRVKPLKRKQAIVQFYELKLARKIQKLEITCNYIFRFEDVQRISLEDWSNKLGVYADTQIYQTIYNRTSQGLGVNPSHHHWRFLLDSGVPLIKRELVSSNPEDLPDIYDFLRQKFPDALKFKSQNRSFSQYKVKHKSPNS